MAEPVRNLPKPAPRKKAAAAGTRARNRTLACSAGIVAGLFILLSIAWYAAADETLLDGLSLLDAFRLPFDDGVKASVAGLENRFGLFGAFTAHFFVDLTVGYFSAAFPLLVIMWCGIVLAGYDRARPVAVTGVVLLFALLLPVTLGTLRYSVAPVDKAWYGLIGAFSADILTGLLGAVGALILMLAAIGAAAVYLLNLDLGASLDAFIGFCRGLIARWRSRSAAGRPAAEQGRTAFTAIARQPERAVTVGAGAGGTGDDDVPGAATAEEEPPVEYPGDEREGPAADAATRGLSIDIRKGAAEPEEGGEEAPPAEDRAGRRAGARPDSPEEIDYAIPSAELLDQPRQSENVDRDELEGNAELVRAKLANFGVEIESVSVTPGPVITLYELVPAEGVKISRIVSLADDLALALAAKGIRIMAPIPGKSAVGVEIPNRNPSLVSLRSVINSSRFRENKGSLPIALGKGIAGDVVVDDLAKMPHLLIAGATGSGKSVGINTLMASLLFRLHPSEIKFIIIDPKKIELTQYARLKYHYLAISPDIQKEIITTPEDAVGVLRSVELEMEKRYDRLAAAGVRSIQDYNERVRGGRLRDTGDVTHAKLPYLVVVIDELADLMLTAAKEVEEPIARLAQLARAVGIHLVLATQRPSVDVITGVIKANFPARIAFQVSSKVDSRTILDMNGAEQLLGSGDMLYLPAGSPKPVRIQNAFISTEEIDRLTDHIQDQQGFSQPYMLPSVLERKRSSMKGGAGARDEFFEEAARLIVRHQQGSVSLLQRRLKVGYSRAARLVDELESAGIVGPYDGSKAREVLLESDEQLDALLKGMDS
jgi:S-DNA-T family DNA segregation ATPase FtsK/SpoIIIE